MRYGSVCSGIEAASVAWEGLGWKAAWFAEIEPFPAAVLASHWPEVPNLGDMTKIADAVRGGACEAPDVLVGGTPCQAFSVAGLRNGLSDARGQLTLSYVELANAIDEKRHAKGEEPAIIVWENVPGVLSSKDNAFGCFLAGLAGESSELQPAGGKWTNAGCVYGPQRAVAWRVLDAQFFGVAQRRRRVFVVASSRNGFDPAKVLFELEGMRRDTPPSREPKSPITLTSGASTESGSHWDNPVNPHPTLNQPNNIGGIGSSNQEIFSPRGAGIVCDGHTTVAYSDVSRTLLAKENDSTAEDLDTYAISMAETQYGVEIAGTLTARHDSSPCADRGMNVLAYGGGNTSGSIDVAACLTAKGNRQDFEVETFALAFPERMSGTQAASTENLAPALMSRNPTAIAFSSKDYGADATFDLSPTLRVGNSDKSRANGGQPPAIALQTDVTPKASIELAFTLKLPSKSGGGQPAAAMTPAMQVRRLTPVECERLQGFPDNHTLISWRGKDAAECPDGPRYRAIGNSMAVPVMRWIGERIAVVATKPETAAVPRAFQRPFLKWAGGKFSLLNELDKHIPAGLRLIEPFVGGGSVFLNSDKHANFLLADVNADLVNLYQMLAVAPTAVIKSAKFMFDRMNTAEDFDAIKAEFNAQSLDAVERAAAFLYLNRHCFNGLMRYNLKNQFNVGFGKYPSPYFPEEEITAFAGMSHNCVFMNAGFRRTIALADEGDVVYCDPPYEPLPFTNGFTSYAAGGFNWEEQVALAECCVAARQRGAKIVISNSTAPRIIELYEHYGFELHLVTGRRSISSKGSTRESAKDLIATL